MLNLALSLLLLGQQPMPPVPPEPPKPTPAIVLPVQVTGKPGTLIKVKAVTQCKGLRWKSWDAGLSLTDPADLSDACTMLVTAAVPGKYTLYCWGCQDMMATDLFPCVILIEGPPTPPAPDTLSVALASLYKDESGDKAKYVKQLAALYREAAVDIDGKDVATTADLLAVLRAMASKGLLPEDAVVSIRAKIGEELRAQLPPSSATTPITDEVRAKAKALFARIATILEGLR